MRESEAGKDDLEALSLGQGEVEDTEQSVLSVSTGETTSEQDGSPSAPFEDAQAEFSFFSPTLGLEPRPAWIKVPTTSMADPRRFVYRPPIPVRPLHKQPFYRRLFFYLHTWLNRIFRKTA